MPRVTVASVGNAMPLHGAGRTDEPAGAWVTRHAVLVTTDTLGENLATS